jgi:peroxiredoxin
MSKIMSISVGDRIPSTTFSKIDANQPQPISTDQIFPEKKVVLVAVTGAFTPDCSNDHLPGFVQNADKIKQQGIDEIVCISVNDPFVMDAWSQAKNTDNKILMLADTEGDFTKEIGMLADVSDNGLGMRSEGYAERNRNVMQQ